MDSHRRPRPPAVSRAWVLLCAAVSRAAALVGDLLSPPVCAACDADVAAADAFCAACRATVQLAPAPRDGEASAAFVYGGAVREAIQRLKYGGRSDLARPLGLALAAAVRRDPGRLVPAGERAIVAPVPLHPARLATRGYNQAALLAAPVARALGVPLVANALVRRLATSAQATLGREERLANVRAAFEARRAVEGCAIVLVDDVVTTGSTFAACERALRDRGAASVRLVALARADTNPAAADHS